MASKWAFLRNKFPALPADPTYGDALNQQTDQYRKHDLAFLAKHCNELEEILAEHEQSVRELKLKVEAAMRVIHDKMEEQSLDSVVMHGYRWSPTYEPYPTVTDRPKLRAWADEHMPDNLSLPWMTLKTVVKDALDPEAGSHELPPGIDVYVKQSFRRTKQ